MPRDLDDNGNDISLDHMTVDLTTLSLNDPSGLVPDAGPLNLGQNDAVKMGSKMNAFGASSVAGELSTKASPNPQLADRNHIDFMARNKTGSGYCIFDKSQDKISYGDVCAQSCQ